MAIWLYYSCLLWGSLYSKVQRFYWNAIHLFTPYSLKWFVYQRNHLFVKYNQWNWFSLKSILCLGFIHISVFLYVYCVFSYFISLLWAILMIFIFLGNHTFDLDLKCVSTCSNSTRSDNWRHSWNSTEFLMHLLFFPSHYFG